MKYLVLLCIALSLHTNVTARKTGARPWGNWKMISEPGKPAVITLIEKIDADNNFESVTITCIKQKGLRAGMAIWLPSGMDGQSIILRIGKEMPLMLKYENHEALIENGYHQNVNDKTVTDVLKQLLENDEMIIQFSDKDGFTKTIPVALSQLHNIYAKLD